MENRFLRRSAIALIRSARTTPQGNGSRSLVLSRGVATAVARAQDVSDESFPVDPRIPTSLNTERRHAIKNAKPFSSFLTDTFQRQHDYLRISITEKCNLRCLYCMPEEGVPQSPPSELLTTPEIHLLSSLFVSQGVTKIRLTGGEPTVRRDILPLMHKIGSLRSQGLLELCLTTNGISLHRKLDSMIEAGLTGVNLSLDTLDPWQFQIMTRRKGFEAVMNSIERILEMNKLGAGVKLKVNCVVMRGMNDREIIPFVEMGREKQIEIRFIEYMPFDGNKWSKGKMLGYLEMLDIIRTKYPDLRKVQDHKNDTSKTYEIPGFEGRFGFITSMTHNFCGSCNRLRITSDGNLKVCLFGNAEVSLRDILRKSNNGDPIDDEAFEAMKKIEMDRREGLTGQLALGISQNEQELLDVIGMAVKRKKAKHAGMGQLENMKNRPMILIDEVSQFCQISRQKPFSQSQLLDSNWRKIPTHLLFPATSPPSLRYFSTTTRHLSSDRPTPRKNNEQPTPKLTHLTSAGTAHMVSIASKTSTRRTAVAVCIIHFSNPTAASLIRENRAKKGDVLGVARIAGIMAAKQTPSLIPLCHPIAITHVSVDVELASPPSPVSSAPSPEAKLAAKSAIERDANDSHVAESGRQEHGSVNVTATVSCDGKTGVEMEALTAAATAALTVYDMCKAVDRGMRIEGLRVVRKQGGASGDWVDGEAVDGS